MIHCADLSQVTLKMTEQDVVGYHRFFVGQIETNFNELLLKSAIDPFPRSDIFEPHDMLFDSIYCVCEDFRFCLR